MSATVMTVTGKRFLRPLKDQQRRALVLLCAGHSNLVISKRVGVSEAQVKTWAHTWSRKVGLVNRTQLAVFAFRNHIVECPCATCDFPSDKRTRIGAESQHADSNSPDPVPPQTV